jgi:hypothetical protein
MLVSLVLEWVHADNHVVFCRSTFLGSRAIAGTLIKHDQLSARGPDGRTLEEVLKTSGGVTGAACCF